MPFLLATFGVPFYVFVSLILIDSIAVAIESACEMPDSGVLLCFPLLDIRKFLFWADILTPIEKYLKTNRTINVNSSEIHQGLINEG